MTGNEQFEIHTRDAVPPTRPRVFSAIVKILLALGVVVIGIALLLPAMRSARGPALRNQCQSQMKQIALALHSYAREHGALPPAYTTDANGKPLHSWRTLILPYMEERQLYQSIDLTKPWDDPINAKALATELPIYRCPAAPWELDNRTPYVAIVTPESCIRATEPNNVPEGSDAARQTIMVIEVDEKHAVPWMSPIDADEKVVVDLVKTKVRTPHANGVYAAFADGRVAFLDDETPENVLRAFISTTPDDNPVLEGAE